jgi:hypothetical protein
MTKAIIRIDAARRKALFSGGASALQYPNTLMSALSGAWTPYESLQRRVEHYRSRTTGAASGVVSAGASSMSADFGIASTTSMPLLWQIMARRSGSS